MYENKWNWNVPTLHNIYKQCRIVGGKKSIFIERFGIAEVLNSEKNFGFYIQIDGQICFEKLQTIKSKWSENQWSELKILK